MRLSTVFVRSAGAVAVSLVVTMAACDGTTPPEPPPPPASWLLTFVDAEVGVESFMPPLIFTIPELQLQERAGTDYNVNFIRLEVLVQEVGYRQVQEMGANDIAREFGSNSFPGNSTQTFTPRFVVTLWPDGELELVVTVGVTDVLGNSKELQVRDFGDTATLKTLIKELRQ